jgi:hypothetical protein
MRRTALLTFAAALALAACTDAGSPDTEGTGGEPAGSAAEDAEPGANESPDPTATLTSPATRGTTAIPTATATAASTTASRSVDSNPAGDECGASKVAPFVSLVATPAVRARLAAKVGHDRIRWVGPDTAVTMDFRPDRLNVALDKANVITGGTCS